MFDLSREFYKQFGGKIFKLYEEFDREKRYRINYQNYSSNSSRVYTIPRINKFYMNLGCASDDRDIICAFIHEAGHVITHKFNEKRYNSTDIFCEIESIFFEILAEQFLRDKLKDDYFLDNEQIRADRYYKVANVIDILNIAYNKVFNNLDKIENHHEAFKKVCHEEGLLKGVSINFDDSVKYVFSFICAVELVEIYKVDKEKAIRLLSDIVSTDKTVPEYEKITRNVTPNEHMEQYVKKLDLKGIN